MVLLLVVLIVAGVLVSPDTGQFLGMRESFENGFTTGYQTMDLFAAFFFSSLVYKQLQEAIPQGASDREIFKYSIKPAILGSIMLGLIYLGLVYLGAHFRHVVDLKTPELMLPQISHHLLGNYSTIFIAIAMVFSCFTTAVALNNIYAKYLCDLLKLKESRFPLMLLFTTAISFVISLLNFRGIAAFLAPVLEASYPGLIALTILSILTQKMHKTKFMVFWFITILMILKILFAA